MFRLLTTFAYAKHYTEQKIADLLSGVYSTVGSDNPRFVHKSFTRRKRTKRGGFFRRLGVTLGLAEERRKIGRRARLQRRGSPSLRSDDSSDSDGSIASPVRRSSVSNVISEAFKTPPSGHGRRQSMFNQETTPLIPDLPAPPPTPAAAAEAQMAFLRLQMELAQLKEQMAKIMANPATAPKLVSILDEPIMESGSMPSTPILTPLGTESMLPAPLLPAPMAALPPPPTPIVPGSLILMDSDPLPPPPVLPTLGVPPPPPLAVAEIAVEMPAFALPPPPPAVLPILVDMTNVLPPPLISAALPPPPPPPPPAAGPAPTNQEPALVRTVNIMTVLQGALGKRKLRPVGRSSPAKRARLTPPPTASTQDVIAQALFKKFSNMRDGSASPTHNDTDFDVDGEETDMENTPPPSSNVQRAVWAGGLNNSFKEAAAAIQTASSKADQ